jgi:adenylate cyclase
MGRAGAILMTVVIGVFFALLSLTEPLPIKALRNIVFDGYQRALPRPYDPKTPVIVVDIDDDSIDRIGQWPWPRSVMASLAAALEVRQPAAVAFDIVFSEPDRSSPEISLSTLPPSPERDALTEKLTIGQYGNDRAFAEALSGLPAVSGVVMADVAKRAPVKAGIASAGDNPIAFVPHFPGAVSPITTLERAFKGFGALNWVPEYDQVVRRVPTMVAQGDQLTPSLALEALRIAQGASTIVIKSSNASGEHAFGQQTGIVSVKVGDVVIPTDSDGAIRVRFAGSRPERRVPAWQVLENKDDKERFKGKIVLVGSSASALADVRATPIDPSVAGVEVHAEILEHALSGSTLRRPDWMPGAEAVLILLSALLAATIGYRLPPVAAASIGLVSIAGLALISWRLFASNDLLLDPTMPSLAGLLAFSSTSVVRWRRSELDRRAVRNAFSHYLSPAMVERLASAPEKLVLGGEQRELTVLFSDVRGFTTLAETYQGDPQGLTQLMNRLLTPLTRAITARSGTIDKFMGDAVMAFWNAPLDVADHAAEACHAALAMREQLNALNTALEREAIEGGRAPVPIRLGIGINTGECVVGNMGSDERFNYSVLGDPVNVASRLEGQTRNYGFDILLGEATAARVRCRFALIELDCIRVHGREQAQCIHALIGGSDLAANPTFVQVREAVAAMLACYRRQDWSGALAALDAMPEQLGVDTFGWSIYAATMRRRIDHYRQNPPPADWDGAYRADKI